MNLWNLITDDDQLPELVGSLITDGLKAVFESQAEVRKHNEPIERVHRALAELNALDTARSNPYLGVERCDAIEARRSVLLDIACELWDYNFARTWPDLHDLLVASGRYPKLPSQHE